MTMRRGYRAGGKVAGIHGTCLPAVGELIDAVERCPYIHRIAPGIIIPGQGSSGGRKRVKITARGGGLLIKVRASGAAQEVRAYATDIREAILWLLEHIPPLGMEVTTGVDTI